MPQLSVLAKRFLVLALFLAQTGCAHVALNRPPTEAVRASLGSIAVVPASYAPETDFRTFAKGTAEGTGKGALIGAGGGAFTGATLAFILAAGGAGALVFPPAWLLLPAAGIGAAVGVVAGSVGGAVYSADETASAEIERAAEDAFSSKSQMMVAEAFIKHAREFAGRELELIEGAGPGASGERPDYRPLKEKGVDTVVEISVMRAGFEDGKGKDPATAVFMTLKTRVVGTGDNKELHLREYAYKSDRLKFNEWTADGSGRFVKESARAYETLAERALEEVFLIPEFGREGYESLGIEWEIYQACGLKPEKPAMEFRFLWVTPEFGAAESLRPELRWSAFPMPKHAKADRSGSLKRVSDISYDLKIWGVAADDLIGALVYERRGIAGPQHRVEEELTPGTKYFWSVWARFSIDGMPAATRWSYSRAPVYKTKNDSAVKPYMSREKMALLVPLAAGAGAAGGVPAVGGPVRETCTLDFIPSPNYFRFKTPD
ncbi:MAG: hypothetical protein HS130_02405 [Deltaproteobacteria bacterium]|nr:hypothetical protein [Deltaproteobacteria bacterium]